MRRKVCKLGRSSYRVGQTLYYLVGFSEMSGTLAQVQCAVVNARSALPPNVNASVRSKEGDTVVVPTGTANWTGTLTIDKAIEAGSQQPNKIFAPGDRFEIRKVKQGLDMIRASTGDLPSGNAPAPRWL